LVCFAQDIEISQVTPVGPQRDEPEAGQQLHRHGDMGPSSLEPSRLLDLRSMTRSRKDANRGRKPPSGNDFIDHDLDLKPIALILFDRLEHRPADCAQACNGWQAEKQPVPEAPVVDKAAAHGIAAVQDGGGERLEMGRHHIEDVRIEEHDHFGIGGCNACCESLRFIRSSRRREDDRPRRRSHARGVVRRTVIDDENAAESAGTLCRCDYGSDCGSLVTGGNDDVVERHGVMLLKN
jgi:hypothetical protein